MESSGLVYDRRGDGSPLLLLHGIGHRRQAWDDVMPWLAEWHDVISVDLPGFGSSWAPRPDEPYGISVLLECLHELCVDLGLDRPHVAGNSLGGALALEMGAQGTARSVTALSPIGFAARHERTQSRLMIRGLGVVARVPGGVRRAAAASPPGRALARWILRGDAAGDLAEDVRFDVDAIAVGSPFVRLAPAVVDYVFDRPHLSCPVTVGWGDRDRVLSARAAPRALERIPHAHQVILLGCGHIPMADRPSVVADLIHGTCVAAEEPTGVLGRRRDVA